MKRKLSLLMVLMMVLSLVPAMNASALGYDIKFSKVAEDLVLKASEEDGRGSWTGGDVELTNGVWASDYDRNDAPTLLIDFPETKIGSGDYDITTPHPGKFSVTLDPDVASFLPGYNYNGDVHGYKQKIVHPGDSAGVYVRRVSPYTIEVEVEPGNVPIVYDGNKRGHKYIEVPFFIQAQGYGDVMASFETHLMKGFPAIKTTKIATVHRNSSTAMVEKVGNLSRNNDIIETSTEYGRIKIVENTIGAWRRAADKTIEIRLDHPDFSFLEARTKARLWNVDAPGAVTFVKDDNNRSILVHLDVLVGHNEYKETARNQVVLDLPIRVARGTTVGTEVHVSLSGEVSPLTLLLAKYTDYAITLKAEKVLDVIAGQDIQNKYIAKVVIEETVPGSLLDGRVLNVALTGVKKEDDKEVLATGKAAYQYDGVVKLERLRGTGDLNIVGSDISNTDKGLTKSARVDKDDAGYEEFDIEVNRGSNLPDNLKDTTKPVNRAMRWELSVPFVVRTDYVGDINLTFDGAGVNKQNVKIATVKAPVTFEIAKTDGGKLADLMIGKQHQEAPDVTIKEVEAGVLQVHDIIRKPTKVDNKYGILGTGTQKSDVLSWGGAIVDGKFKVLDGDAAIEGTSGRNDVKERMFSLRKKSTKASTFKLENVKVTLDRTVPYGPYQVYVDAGNVKARHKSLTDFIATPDYFNVVTPYPQDKDVKTVFTIGEKKYVQTISGVEKEVEMPVAPQISENRTMLPVRYFSEALNAVVNYNPDTRLATIAKDQIVITINIDKDVMYVNGSPVKLLAKPLNEEGRIFLPLVSIAQAFGLSNGNTEDGMVNDIEWDAAAKTVTLFEKKSVIEGR